MVQQVYICAAGHSGSTLLDLLLGSHSLVESLGEIAHLPKNVALNTQCSCGAPVRSCAFWKPVLVELGAQLQRDLLVEPYALRTGYPRAVTLVDRRRQTRTYLLTRKILHGLAYLELFREWHFIRPLTGLLRSGVEHRLLIYDAARRFAGVKLVVDSSKSYLEATSLYRRSPDDTRIILLTRDGRGVMYSNIKMKLGRQRGLHGWKNYYLRALPLLAKCVPSSHVLTVRYESLASDPESELARICGFLGLEYEQSMQDFSSREHHVTNGNNMRFSSSSYIRLDESWKVNLTPEDLDYFDRYAGALNRRLGYQ